MHSPEQGREKLNDYPNRHYFVVDWRKTVASVLKILSFIRSRLLLIILGLSCELLYMLYFVRQFPLLKYYHSSTDMGYILGHSHAGFAVFVVVFSVLFTLLGFAWWEARHLTDRPTLYLILGFGGLFAFTMIFVYPVTAIDVFIYIAESLVLVQYHANPILVPAATYSNDPAIVLAGGWTNLPAPYGPLGILIDALPTLIVGRNLLANLLLVKLMFSSMLIIEAFLIYKILSRITPKLALAGALFIAWNPYALFEYSANSHNDVCMMLFVLLATLALVYDRLLLAFILVVASVLVKYATLPLLPLFFIYGIVHQPTGQKRMTYLTLALLSALLLVVAIYGPFWRGLNSLNTVLSQDQRYMSSFSTMLTDISSGQVTQDGAKLLGRVLFGITYVYALFLSTKRLPDMLRACFLALFFFLALAVTNFEIWYGIWPAMFAILLPSVAVSLSLFVFVYGASLSVTAYVYLWVWLGLTTPNLAIVNNLAYLITFMPAILIIFCFALQQMLSVKYAIDKSLPDDPMRVTENEHQMEDVPSGKMWGDNLYGSS
jgi:hypothetical protein